MSSFARYKLLFRKQWVEHRRLYLMGALVIFLLQLGLLLLAVFTADQGLGGGIAPVISILGALLTGSMFTSIQLNSFRNRSEAIFAFMLPASAKEKVLVAATYALIIFPLVFFTMFTINYFLAHLAEVKMAYRISRLEMARPHFALFVLLMFWVAQGFVMFCSLLFRRFAFMISVAVMIVVSIISVSVNTRLVDAMVQGRSPGQQYYSDLYQGNITGGRLKQAYPFSEAEFAVDIVQKHSQQTLEVYYPINLSSGGFWLYNAFLLFVTLFLLYAVGVKLREQQL